MKNNLYTNLVNFYNVNDENFKEFMSELYKQLLENNRDVKYAKDHLTEEIEKKLKEYIIDGKLNIKIDRNIYSELKKKANITKINDLQGQINNLVFGASGDGNNPEVVQARGRYTILNDRLNLIETGYKKVNIGYIDLTNADFVNSTKNRIATNGIPITEEGVITVNYVPKQDHVFIQHLRYNTTAKKFTIIESMRVNCRQDTINTTVCNFNIDTSGNDYIAIEGIGFTTNDKTIGYMFLQNTNYEQNTSITEYNTPLQKVYGASFGYYITVNRLDIDDVKNNLTGLNTEVEECANSLKTVKYTNEQEQQLNMLSGGFWNHEKAYVQANSTWSNFWYNSTAINVVPGEVYRFTNIGGTGNLHPVLFENSYDVDGNGKPFIKSM